MGALHLTALDGGVVNLSSPLDLTASGTTSFIVFDIGGYRQEFGSGGLDFGDIEAANHGVTFDEEYSFQDGRLRLGSVVQTDGGVSNILRLAVWQGLERSLKTVIYEGESKDLIGLLDLFTIIEGAGGLVLKAKDPTVITVVRETSSAPDIAQPLPGFGLLDIFELTPSMGRLLPEWGGFQSPNGELFVEEPGTSEMTLVYVGESAFARFYPDENVSESDLLNLVTALDVRWEAENSE